MTLEKIDDDGTWHSTDDGTTWHLVEASAEFRARQQAAAASATDDAQSDPVQVAAETIRDEISARLAPPSVNTIVEVKAAVIDGLDAAVARLST